MTKLGLVMLAALNGIAISGVIKYTDNIIKVYVYMFSATLTTILSIIFFDFHLNGPFLVALVLVSASLYLYHTKPKEEVQEKPDDVEAAPLVNENIEPDIVVSREGEQQKKGDMEEDNKV